MSSETPTSPQDAFEELDPSLPSTQLASVPAPLMEAHVEAYLQQLAMKLTEWQQTIFNSAAKEGNFIGLRNLSHDVQVAAYELRVTMGQSTIEAKVGAGMTLTPGEAQAVTNLFEAMEKDTLEQEAADRRAEAVRRHQEGLHHVPTQLMSFEQGRRADREGQ